MRIVRIVGAGGGGARVTTFLFGAVVGFVVGVWVARRTVRPHVTIRPPAQDARGGGEDGSARVAEIRARAHLALERAAEVRARRARHLRTLREQREAEERAYMRGATDAVAGRPPRLRPRRRT